MDIKTSVIDFYSNLSFWKVVKILIVVNIIAYILRKLTNSVRRPEHFAGAPLNESIGEYSNIRFKYEGADYSRRPNKHDSLLLNNISVSQGTPLPLEYESTVSFPPYPETSGTSVDGTADTPDSMFMFSYNQCKPECCPSTFSCSGGCVCTTPKQREFVSKRGNNSKYDEGF